MDNIIKKQFSIIVVIAQNYAIGKNNQLLWHIPEDMKFFKKITAEHTVIMGKNTYHSLPSKFKPLPKRRNIVITDVQGEEIPGCEMAYSINDAMEKADTNSENFIMGGASVYRQFFPIAQKLYITRVYENADADVFFPEIRDEDWQLLESLPQQEKHPEGLKYDFNIYLRR
jgi:dihydrofolate reductase